MKLTGITIHTQPFREADLILRILTLEHGKISAVARAARKSKKRFPGSLDLFDSGSFELSTSRRVSSFPAPAGENPHRLQTVESFSRTHSFRGLREDLNLMVLASLLCESFDLIAQEHSVEHGGELYEVLHLALTNLNETKYSKDALRITHLALVNLLSISGFMDPEMAPAPSLKGMRTLLAQLEELKGHQFYTREPVEEILESLVPQANALQG